MVNTTTFFYGHVIALAVLNNLNEIFEISSHQVCLCCDCFSLCPFFVNFALEIPRLGHVHGCCLQE